MFIDGHFIPATVWSLVISAHCRLLSAPQLGQSITTLAIFPTRIYFYPNDGFPKVLKMASLWIKLRGFHFQPVQGVALASRKFLFKMKWHKSRIDGNKEVYVPACLVFGCRTRRATPKGARLQRFFWCQAICSSGQDQAGAKVEARVNIEISIVSHK